jgi:hypothetical protein
MTRSTPRRPGRTRSRDHHAHLSSGSSASGADSADLDAPPADGAELSPDTTGGSEFGGVLRLGEMADLPASVSLLEAARALGIGRTSAYNLARQGQFPCPLIKVGALYRVPTAALLRLLALTPPVPTHLRHDG